MRACSKSVASWIALILGLVLVPRPSQAFCGFYVGGADAKLFNDATQVVLMREGTRTVLSMQNDYNGPPRDFALVVPVPVVLQPDNVKTLPKALFERVDALSAPRLVEYWEGDPCAGTDDEGENSDKPRAKLKDGPKDSAASASSSVKIEAQFEVGEYDVVILSAEDSGALEAWLRANAYKIPENAASAFVPYIQAGSKFFVAKVNVSKVKFDNGRAVLSPLRFHYDSEKFTLPIRLGLLNSRGTQDLIVHVLAPHGQRYTVSNYPEAVIPTNLDVSEAARAGFGKFYAALFDKTIAATPRAVVTEYAWGARSCDPCPGSIQGLSREDLATLGADVLPSSVTKHVAPGPRSEVKVTVEKSEGVKDVDRFLPEIRERARSCHEAGLAGPSRSSGALHVKMTVGADGKVTNITTSGTVISGVGSCVDATLRRVVFTNGPGTLNVGIDLTAMSDKVDAGARRPATSLMNIAPDFVLTRLHARYSAADLADDLVFADAAPIRGGREVYERGGVELGAAASRRNEFQARYAIRHAWTGPITCNKPRRGQWGGSRTGKPSEPLAATKLAYVSRDAPLSDFLSKDLDMKLVAMPSAQPSATPPATDGGVVDAGAPSPTTRDDKGRCGCEAVGAPSSRTAGVLVLGLLLTVAGRRRRTRHIFVPPRARGVD